MSDLSRARPDLIEYEPAPQFRAGYWFLALLGVWVSYILLGGDFTWSTFLLGAATGAIFTRWIVGINGYKPTANARLIGPNVKLLFYVALLFGISITSSYVFGWIILGGPNGWFGTGVAKVVCGYLTGVC